MDKKNNIYNYKVPKSKNEEVHFFLTKGRITIKTFFLRILFAICIVAIFNSVYYFYALPQKTEKEVFNDLEEKIIRDETFKISFEVYKKISFYIIPSLMLIFISIQLVKRIHDVNKSGWYAFVPIYNLILLFSKGSIGNNDYGVNPRSEKKIKYFDELSNKV